MATAPQHLQFDKNLEGLRGLCALIVAIAHVFVFAFFGSDKLPGYGWLLNLQFARVAVLLFFLISGYVIGINHFNTPFNLPNVKTYLKKRLVRLYPNYILSLALSLVVIPVAIPAVTILAHLFFLQEFWVSTISSNVVLWSLSYEAFYYLLFMLMWAFNKSSNVLFIIVALLALGYICIGPNNSIFKSVIIGALFWVAGLFISQQPRLNNTGGSRIFAYLAAMMATHALKSGEIVLQQTHLNFSSPYKITVADLFFLPVCIVIICEISNRAVRYLHWIKILAFLIPLLHLCLMIYLGHNMFRHYNWGLGLVFMIIALVLAVAPFRSNFFQRLASTGKVSYAIYIFHFPIGYGLNIWLGHYLSGTAFFIIGVMIFIAITGAVSVLTDVVLQPKIKQLFAVNKTPSVNLQAR